MKRTNFLISLDIKDMYSNNFSRFMVFDYVTLGEIATCPESRC